MTDVKKVINTFEQLAKTTQGLEATAKSVREAIEKFCQSKLVKEARKELDAQKEKYAEFARSHCINDEETRSI